MTDRLLIVDDDPRLSAMVADYLAETGFAVERRSTGQAGLDALGRSRFEAVILDIMLPDLDGLDVLRRIRARSTVPVLMLTARGEDTDRIIGLEIGADDYLPKPFNPRELLARLRAVLRRRGAASPMDDEAMRFGRLTVDRGSRTVSVDGVARAMTSYQFDLLVALASHAGRVLGRDYLLDHVKGEELDAFDRSIDVHVSRIRAAIEDDPKHPRRIITVRGIGYVFAKRQDADP